MQKKIIVALFFVIFSGSALSFDYPMFRVTRDGEFVGTLVGTIHYLLSATSAPDRLKKVLKNETDLLVLESDMREENIQRVRRDFLPKLRSECGVYASSSKEDQEFLEDLARTTPGIDPERAKTFLLGDWDQVVTARTNMTGGDLNGKSLYEGIERIVYRVSPVSEMRFLETFQEYARKENCPEKQRVSEVVSGFRRLMQCIPCQKERSKETLNLLMLDRHNWKSRAGKVLSESLRYYGVNDLLQIRSRNKAWADRFVELTKEKQRLTTFVGVAHLVGDGSFIEELEKKGFTVTEIPWTDQDE